MTCKPAFVARGPDASDKHAATAAKRLASDEAGGASDHLAIARAFARWRESPAEATRTYSLARGTMRDVARARDQLARTLRESGFDPDGPACAANANNDDLARCALVAGLFPNVARVAPGERSGGGKGGGGRGGGHGAGRARRRVISARGVEVAVHPSSVNAPGGGDGGGGDGGGGGGGGGGCSDRPPLGYLAYAEEVETSRRYLRETTAVPDEAVLLFGGTIRVDHAGGTVSVALGRGGGEGEGAGARVQGRAGDGRAVQAPAEGAGRALAPRGEGPGRD